MAGEKFSATLRHYTSIEGLFGILDSKSLLLSSPEKWEDQNDSAALRAFCRLKEEETKTKTKAGVLCFLDGEESIHHQKTYAKNGCSISVGRDYILKQVTDKTCFLHGPIEYKHNITADELRKLAKNEANKIPFLKRNQYECEKELRIIWFGAENKEVPKIKLEIKAIKRLILSPWMPDINREKLKDYLEKTYEIEAQFSCLLKFKQWINSFDNFNKKK